MGRRIDPSTFLTSIIDTESMNSRKRDGYVVRAFAHGAIGRRIDPSTFLMSIIDTESMNSRKRHSYVVRVRSWCDGSSDRSFHFPNKYHRHRVNEQQEERRLCCKSVRSWCDWSSDRSFHFPNEYHRHRVNEQQEETQLCCKSSLMVRWVVGSILPLS